MGKTIWAEDSLQEYIASVCNEASSPTIGIIAGHKSSQRDYAVALFPTPPEDDDEEEEVPGGGKEERNGRDLAGVSDQWVSEHARQSTAKPTDWRFQSFVNNWSSVSCRFEVHLRIPFQSRFRDCSHYSKFVLMNGMAMRIQRPLENLRNRFRQYGSCHFFFMNTSGADNILNAVQDSVVLVNGQLRDGNEAIESLQGKKKGGKKPSAGSSQSMEINAELLMEKSVQSPPQDLETSIAGDTNIIGWIQARGYLCPRSTFRDVEKVIKDDIERSLRVRFDLLGEELRQSSGEEEVKELDIEPPSIIATPQRVFAKLPGTPISVSDYVFQDEQPQDVRAHFLELLNIAVTEEDVDFDSEQMPDDSLLQQIETASSQSSDSANLEELLHKPHQGRRTMLRYAGLAFAGVGAAVAAGISYLSMSDQGGAEYAE